MYIYLHTYIHIYTHTYIYSSRSGAVCETAGGACALPFTFDGVEHHSCAGVGAAAWCSLTPIFQGRRADCPDVCLSEGTLGLSTVESPCGVRRPAPLDDVQVSCRAAQRQPLSAMRSSSHARRCRCSCPSRTSPSSSTSGGSPLITGKTTVRRMVSRWSFEMRSKRAEASARRARRPTKLLASATHRRRRKRPPRRASCRFGACGTGRC